jgi:hypothetical protein
MLSSTLPIVEVEAEVKVEVEVEEVVDPLLHAL